MLRALTVIALSIAAPSAAATTIQQDFDAAQALLDGGKAAEARTAFAALLTRFSPTSRGKAASLVRARLGNVLIATGDSEAAETMLTTATAGFSGTTAQDKEERGVALYDLGRAFETQGKLDSAAESYRNTLEASLFNVDSAAELGLRAALARALIWSNPAEARRLLDGLLAVPRERFGTAPASFALLQTLRGRVELNNGNPAEARRWFAMAAKTAGGAETQQVSLADVRIRGDLALANFKLGSMGEVQKNVAFSGAGALLSEGLTMAASMPVPACSPSTGLAPDAVAVVEFAIDADGRVSSVTPVYASRGSSAAVTGSSNDGPEVLFPQAVRRWYWNAGNVGKLDAFWRQSIRVELRCFTSRPDIDTVAQSFDRDFAEWQEAKGLRPLPDLPDNDAASLPILRAELARREAADGAQSLQLYPPLNFIAGNDAAPETERQAAAKRRMAMLESANAPATVIGHRRLSDIARGGALASAPVASATG
jgi:tetratricopeptide (TPR) repeat protein